VHKPEGTDIGTSKRLNPIIDPRREPISTTSTIFETGNQACFGYARNVETTIVAECQLDWGAAVEPTL
jgi:hypothetical protein